MLKKNDRVKMGSKIGTVIGNSWRHYGVGSFAEVLFDGEEFMATVSVDELTKINK